MADDRGGSEGGVASYTTTPEERAQAAMMRTSNVVITEHENNRSDHYALIRKLREVEIGEGTFKYVLIRVEGQDGPKHLVRGVVGAAYHMDSARPTVELLERIGATYTVLGGGRIRHTTQSKEIFIYGHSYGFPWQGACMHNVSADLCRQAYPSHNVTWSAEGY